MTSDSTAVGSVSWHDITAFQRDIVIVVVALNEAPPSGAGIKERLDERYGEEIVRSRLYQALDDLVQKGLLEKGPGTRDARTNHYALTDEARRLIEEHARRCASAVGFALERPESVEP